MMSVYKGIITFVFLLMYLSSYAQLLEGTVKNIEGEGLANTLIYFKEKKISNYTNLEGEFKIRVDSVLNCTFIVQAIGYETKEFQIQKEAFEKTQHFILNDLNLELNEVELVAKEKTMHGYSRLRAIEGTSIFSGKKTSVVDMETINANIANNSSRQIFSKVSGLNIWESDCSGIQLGVGSRGLSPSRTSNFNVRQNGYDVSADAIGYPDAYYAPPMQALKSIEVVKGAASLQFGTQFGGLINFKLKEPIKDKKIQLNSATTLGSFKYLNSFNRLSGTIGKFSYNTFYQYRRGDCWRCNSTFNYHSGFANMKYQLSPKLAINFEYSNLKYLAQQPGGLTDALFDKDAKQSIRDRNWFRIFWNVVTFKINYKISSKTSLDVFALGQYSGRDASGFLGRISRTDPLDQTSLLKDEYKNGIFESRLLHRFSVRGKLLAVLVGVRYMQGKTTKKQGDTSNDKIASFSYLNPDRLEGSDYLFPSRNISVFTETIFNLSDKLSFILGGRYEYINQKALGYYTFRNFDFAGNILLDTTFNETKNLKRSFPFFGGGISYKQSEDIELYTNFSQNYRAIGFNDLRIVNPNLVIDPNLSDEKGFNFDLGLKGNSKNKFIFYDASFFVLKYNNKIGTYFTKIPDPIILERVVRYRTNFSEAISYGIELFAQADLYGLLSKNKNKTPVSFSVYTNLAFINAIYSDSKQSAFYRKKIEDVPPFTARLGWDFQWKKLRIGMQYTYTHKHFSDATNATFVADATVGLIPSYYTLDFNANYQWKNIGLQLAINNFTNNKYFTRRADGYPGPGILPSDALNANITLNFKL